MAGLLVDLAAALDQGDRRAASKSIARPSERSELRFLISDPVPSLVEPVGRIDTFASMRIIFLHATSDAPLAINTPRNSDP